MQKDQTVSEMAEEALARQAKAYAHQAGTPWKMRVKPSQRPMPADS